MDANFHESSGWVFTEHRVKARYGVLEDQPRTGAKTYPVGSKESVGLWVVFIGATLGGAVMVT